MGREVVCKAVIDGAAAEGRALLETDEVLFRGTPRLRLKFAAITTIQVTGGTLVLRHIDGEARLSLGAKEATRWAAFIRKPPELLTKLGIGAATKVAVLGVPDAEFDAAVGAVARVRRDRRTKGLDLVLVGAEARGGLHGLKDLERLIHPAGGIWVVYPKGRTEIREADVLAAGRAAGWKDAKVCRFSATHTALKFVIPLSARPPAPAPARRVTRRA